MGKFDPGTKKLEFLKLFVNISRRFHYIGQLRWRRIIFYVLFVRIGSQGQIKFEGPKQLLVNEPVTRL